MAHLGKMRRGWENENLARFILSRFSFIANPTTVADDLGVDFFCTIFKRIQQGSEQYLLPQSSFAIQVKSSVDTFDVTGKIDYLLNLELPYFVGVVNQTDLKLTIYSGEYIPVFFSHKGIPTKLNIRPVDSVSSQEEYSEEFRNRKFSLNLPKVAEIDVNANSKLIIEVSQSLDKICSEVQKNISTRKSGETIYYLPCLKEGFILAGPGSATVFRENFFKRFAEVLYNLFYSLQSPHGAALVEEAKFYMNFYDALKAREQSLPDYLVQTYNGLKSLISPRPLVDISRPGPDI